MVPRTVGDDATRPHLIGESPDGVERTASLERADVLEILGLEVELAARELFQQGRPDRGGTHHFAAEARSGGLELSAP